ncbi:protein rep [Bacillus cereus]
MSNNGTFELSGAAVAEMAKYSVKSSDYLIYNEYEKKGSKYIPVVESGIDEETTDEVVQTLDEALARRRLIAFGGLMKEVWERLRIEGKMVDAESEEVNLVHVNEDTKCQCSVCGSNMLEELYSWLPEYKN